MAERLVNGEDKVSVRAADQFKGHSRRPVVGIFSATGRAELGVTAERNEFKGSAMGTAIHGTAKRRVTTVDYLINVIHDNRSGFYIVFNDFIIIFEHRLYHIHKVIMKQRSEKSKPLPLKIEGQGELSRRSLFFINWLSHRAVLSVIGLISCTTLLFSYIFIYDGANDRVKTEKKEESQMSPLRFIFSPRVFFYFIGIVIPVVAAGYFLAYLYPLMGEEFGISETNIGYSYLLNGICIVFLGAVLTKMLMRKISKKGILVTAALLYAAAFFLVSAYPGVLTLLASLILLGISDSYGLPMQSTYYTDLPEVQRYGYDRAMGMYSLFENMSQVLGSFLFGIIYVNGIGTGLFYAGTVLLVLAALFYLTGRKNAKGEKYGDSF